MPDCPHRLNVVVGLKCRNEKCWLNESKAKYACIALDVGTTEVTANDLARILQITREEATSRVERGRRKIASWLNLLRLAEDLDTAGCASCGRENCDSASCATATVEVEFAKKLVPVDSTAVWSAAKWRALLESGAISRYMEESGVVSRNTKEDSDG